MLHTQLRAFHAVASSGGFSRAADRLGVTQPALTIQVRNLERERGVRLFERHGDGVELTAPGRRLFALTADLAGLEAKIDGLLAQAGELAGGELRLAADGPHLAMRLIAVFRSRYPGIRISLKLGNAAEVWREMADGQVDAVVAAAAPKGAQFKTTPLRESQLVAIVPQGHRWTGHRSLDMAAMSGEPVIMREPASNTQRTLMRALRRAGVDPVPVLELGSREAVIEAVAAGLGVGFIFSGETTPDSRYTAIELDGPGAVNREVAGCLSRRREDGIVKAFLEVAEAWTGR